ncbi:MAG: DUF935 family protein [Verrucomicrobiota bacterium]
MKLFSRLKKLFSSHRVPVEHEGDEEGTSSVGTAMGEPPAIAHTLSAERLQGILRAAEAGDTADLFSLYRDIRIGHAHSQTVLNQRQLNALNKTLTIVPADEKNPDDLIAAKACRVLTSHPSWQVSALAHLIKGHFYPLAVLEQTFVPAPSFHPLGLRWLPGDWRGVPFHLLDFTEGRLRLWNCDAHTGARAATKRDIGEDVHGQHSDMRHIVHRGHLLTDIPDNWGGPMRAVLFWWLFAVMDRDWWVRFLDRFGAPFLVARVDSEDEKSKRLITSAFSAATKLFGLVVSKETDIQVNAVATSSHGEAFEKLQSFANGEISKLFLGQTMTVTAQASGLGGGAQAEVQENTLGDIEAWDLTVLAATANSSIIGPFLRINGLRGSAIMQVATDTTRELTAKTSFLKAATEAGLEPTDEAIESLSKASGIQLRRKAAAPLSFSAFAADPSDHGTAEAILRRYGKPTPSELDVIAQRGAGRFAKAFSTRHAGITDLIAASTSLDDLQAKLTTHFSSLNPGEAAEAFEEVLNAYAATGAATARQP